MITIVSITSFVLSVSSIIIFAGIIALTAVAGTRAVYKKVALRYAVFTRNDAKVVSKTFDGRTAQASDPEPLFEECQMVVCCGGESYTFNDPGVYARYEVGQTVRLLIHSGFNKNWELKDTFFSLAD